ncbi:GTP pyrophosphokinase family protein [Ruminococcus sp.]|uniref:GTP pyrophosphokinase n=1 Tax=Ruminococcus sp. TaxID=41978 RepID=UPI0025E2A9E2|nr:GTP pyrophosphokinase family protein [Ruminococcus sp.]MBQ8966684.1 GTP pyrophosphokinase family protein [Ruminococcus sp.]
MSDREQNFGELFNDVINSSDLALPALSNDEVQFVYSQTKQILGTMVEYKELMMMYTCAIKEVKTKFDVLNTEFNVRYRRNPIEFISTRLKRTSSIAEKLAKKGLPMNPQTIEENLSDVAGVRVICAYIDDIYSIADALIQQDDITLIARKDYIASPKPNGYRSLHLIVSVPVFFAEEKRDMRVEVQIRTIAMDFWASLEHQLKYKQAVENEQEIVDRLRACAEVISSTDREMLSIRSEIEQAADIPSEDDILFEKMKNFDVPIY